jgi:excisionase family DNA binding protein
MPEFEKENLLEVQQAAEIMHVSRQTVYAWIKSGKLTTIKTPGGRQRIPSDQLFFNKSEKLSTQKIEYFRIEDISAYEPMRTEPTGLKEKWWFARRDDNWYWEIEGDRFLFKAGRNNTGENWAEIVACELARLIGLPHAEYKFAKYKEKNGVITPSFVPSRAGLILGNEILPYIVKEYKSEQRYKQKKHTLPRVIRAIAQSIELPIGWNKIEGIDDSVDVFVGYLMLDTWIANTDRHHENWGFVLDLNDNEFHLAPTFDHASSLGSHESDGNRKERIITKDHNRNIRTYVNKARSALYKKQSDDFPMLTIDAFKEAAKIREKAAIVWLKRLDSVMKKDITGILEKVPREVMSEISKEFAQNVLEENKRRLLE